ncbi:MAG: hypothetical protein C0609_10635 [Deltaproteobacteria bacterium]|nr:MAG: hypothetical protein C0609_10635 [Deltaproteobacteria bacterium]
MRYIATLLLFLLAAPLAWAAPEARIELVAFDYNALSIGSGDDVGISWSGTVESYLSYKVKCRVVLSLTTGEGERHEFSSPPVDLMGLSKAELSGDFDVPRQLWDVAEIVEVEAAEGELEAQIQKPNQQAKMKVSLERCKADSLSDPEAYRYHKNLIYEKDVEIKRLEVLLHEAGMAEGKAVSARKVKEWERSKVALEEERATLVDKLERAIDAYCSELYGDK